MNSLQRTVSIIIAIISITTAFELSSITVAQNDYGDRVIDLEWSPDGAFLAVGYESGTLEIRDGQSGDTIFTYEPESGLRSFGWSPDSEHLAFTNGGYNYEAYLSIFNISTQSIEASIDFYASVLGDVEWSPDGTQIAVMSAEALRDWGMQGIAVFDVTDDSLAWAAYYDTGFGPMHWRPNSTQVAAVDMWRGLIEFADLSVSPDFLSGSLYDAQVYFNQFAFSPDGSMLAALDDQAVLRIYDAETRTELAEIETAIGGTIAWSPDGRFVAIGGGITITDGRLIIYHVETEQALATLNTHCIQHVAWSPDGTRIAYGGIDSFQMIPASTLPH